MKIRRKEELSAEEIRALQGNQNRGKANPAATSIVAGEQGESETIDVSRGVMMGQILGSGISNEERQRRLDSIRQAVNEGSYLKNIDIFAVASKTSEEIGLEIASARVAGLLDE